MANKRSPLKARPLRNPGQSLDEQISALVSDYTLGPVIFALFMVLVSLSEWLKYYYSLPPRPLVYSTVAVPALGYAVWQFFRIRSDVKRRQLGRDGEKVVGQFLEGFRDRGYRVFHDVVGDGFNVDHILIGPAGIFTVETKTHRKPNGNPEIVFDGETIRIDGFEPDRNPVLQARAQASWLRKLLSESTGHRFEVKSVIVYPGWWAHERNAKANTVWVLEPKRLPIFLDEEPRRLSQDDIHLASFHLSRFVRTVA